jgi:hypothetical protein
VQPEPPAAGRVVGCPDCGGPVRPDRDQLCPRCGYPLMYLPSQPVEGPPAEPRTPGVGDDATFVTGPPPAATDFPVGPLPEPATPAAGQLRCPRCGQPNPQTRIRCERCGEELRPTGPIPALSGLVAPPPGRRSRGWVVAAAVLLVVVTVIGGGALLIRSVRDTGGPGGGRTTTPSHPTAQPELQAVRPDTVTASASSTLPDTATRTYGIRNTLDGARSTAWNSDGKRVGVRLTFRFDRPQRLRRITVVNGYARTAKLFRQNARVARFTVRTDHAERSWTLRDVATTQALNADLGSTRQVVLAVDAVYAGDSFTDLALTEIAFFARG